MNDTLRTAIVAGLSAAAGAFLALFLMGDNPPSLPAATDSSGIDALRERVAALESSVTTTDFAEDRPPGTAEPGTGNATDDQAPAEEASREQLIADRLERQAERLGTRLREAGWSDAEIDSLTELRARAALELEQRQYDAMRQRLQEDPDELSRWRNQQDVMREALGDEKYEQFLQAAGRPVAAEVHDVLAGSAGDSAGLKTGDQIRRYGSTRIFNRMDLMLAELDGEPGEPVSIEIERDGATFHITVPRGPLGVSRAARFGRDF